VLLPKTGARPEPVVVAVRDRHGAGARASKESLSLRRPCRRGWPSKVSPRLGSIPGDSPGLGRTTIRSETRGILEPSDERRAASPAYEMPPTRVRFPAPPPLVGTRRSASLPPLGHRHDCTSGPRAGPPATALDRSRQRAFDVGHDWRIMEAVVQRPRWCFW
jgi:hypothetical protein